MQQFFVIVASLCFFILLVSLLVEHVLYIEPCILCTLQRILFFFIAITCVIGLVINSFKNLFVKILDWFCITSVLFYSVMGTLIGARQSWLQIFPSKNLTCSVGLWPLIKQYSLAVVLKKIINGSLGCSDIGLRILGLSLANWALISFVFILILGSITVYATSKT